MSGSNGNGNAPKWEQFMRSKGATDEEIADARKENDQNFSKQRRSDRDRLDQMEQRITQLTGGNGSNGTAHTQNPNQKMPWDAIMEEHGITQEKAPDLHKAFSKAFMTVYQSSVMAAQQLAQQQNAPIAFQNKLASDRRDLEERFGKERVDKIWPELESEVRSRAQRGEAFSHAEDVFRGAFREEYDDAVYHSEDARRRKTRDENKSKTTEGFQQTQRSAPMQIADGRKDDEPTFDLDANIQDIIAESMKEAGITI